METVRIATRKSPLAPLAKRTRRQPPAPGPSRAACGTGADEHPRDEVLDRSLAAIGGKGLFLKELELAMLRGEADCAVHSLKDVPMELDEPFALPAMLTRHDPADGFVSNLYASLDALPIGARSAPHRCAARPSCARCARIWNCWTCAATSTPAWPSSTNGGYDAIVLAVAGLERLGLGGRIVAAPATAAVAAGTRRRARWRWSATVEYAPDGAVRHA